MVRLRSAGMEGKRKPRLGVWQRRKKWHGGMNGETAKRYITIASVNDDRRGEGFQRHSCGPDGARGHKKDWMDLRQKKATSYLNFLGVEGWARNEPKDVSAGFWVGDCGQKSKGELKNHPGSMAIWEHISMDTEFEDEKAFKKKKMFKNHPQKWGGSTPS